MLNAWKYKDVNYSVSQKSLAACATKEFNLPRAWQAFISSIIKIRADLEAMNSRSLNAKRKRLVQHPVVEKAVVVLMLQF